MFPKTLLTAFSLLILASNALAAPALSCPAAGASSSSSVAAASDIASSVASSSVAKATSVASSSAKVTTHAASSSAKAASSSAKATQAASSSAKAVSSSAKATQAASSSAKVTATSVKSSAAGKSTGASKATGASLAAAPSATGTSSTAASFGSCSSPEIKFAAGLDGRKETSFAPANTNSFNHGSADAITVITDFICQQLQSKCKANAAAIADCKTGTTAANAAAKGTGAQADAFNAAFGIKSNFANVAVVNNQGKTVGGSSATAASSSSSALTNGAVASSTAAVSSSSVVASSSVASSSSAASSTSSSSAGSSSAEQSSNVLDSAVIATGFAQDGQATPAAGQVASLTSTNNFINFCLTVDKPITNGQQIKTGSCNPAPMGVIAATTNMPSSKFTFPTNFGSVKANTAFTISMAINNLETGNFVNADSNYYSAPQQVNSAGDIIGHSHVVIEQIDSLNSTALSDPTKFAFFKGINGAAVNGIVTADVTDGLPAGIYRMASINAAANHQPVLVAVAQHGSLDDMVYFTVN